MRVHAAWKDREQKNLRSRSVPAKFIDHGSHPVGRLLRGPILADVVRSDHQDNDLRMETYQLAILQAPKHVIGPIAAKSKVGSLQRSDLILPNLAARIFPALGDRITEKRHVDMRGLCHANA